MLKETWKIKLNFVKEDWWTDYCHGKVLYQNSQGNGQMHSWKKCGMT